MNTFGTEKVDDVGVFSILLLLNVYFYYVLFYKWENNLMILTP